MAEFSSVDCCEVHSSRVENFTANGMECSVSLQCSSANRFSLAADIVGGRKPWPFGSFAVPARAISSSAKPLADQGVTDDQSITYEDYIVTVNYSNAREDSEEDLISETLEPNVEFLTLDFRKFRWGSAGGAALIEGEAPGLQVRSLNLVRTHYGVTALPEELITAIGFVNDTAYTSALLGLTFAEETLLYAGASPSRKITTEGAGAWDVNMKFSYKPETWNKYYRAATGTWQRMYRAASAEGAGGVWDSYPPGDFSALLY